MKYNNSGIYNATLDPTNPRTYEILNSILMKYAHYFQAVTFILVVMRTMARNGMQTQLFSNYMKENSIGNKNDLQTYFNMKLIPMLKNMTKKLMGWEEI
jgi:hexosaminidase